MPRQPRARCRNRTRSRCGASPSRWPRGRASGTGPSGSSTCRGRGEACARRCAAGRAPPPLRGGSGAGVVTFRGAGAITAVVVRLNLEGRFATSARGETRPAGLRRHPEDMVGGRDARAPVGVVTPSQISIDERPKRKRLAPAKKCNSTSAFGDAFARRRRAVGATVEAPHLDARPNHRCRHNSSRAFPRPRHGTPRAGEATPARTRIVSCRRFREARRLRWCAKTFLTTRRTRPHPLPSARRLRAFFASPLRSKAGGAYTTTSSERTSSPPSSSRARATWRLTWARRSIGRTALATTSRRVSPPPARSSSAGSPSTRRALRQVRRGPGYPNFAYQGAGGNAVRKNVVGDRVFTANESPRTR